MINKFKEVKILKEEIERQDRQYNNLLIKYNKLKKEKEQCEYSYEKIYLLNLKQKEKIKKLKSENKGE